MRIPINFARHSYKARAGTISSQRLINLYPEVNPPDDKTNITLVGTSGLLLFTTVGTGPIWGTHLFGSLLYVVSGDNVYTVDSTGSSTDLGSIGTVASNVEIANDGVEVIIVNSGAGWVATPSTLTQITDGDFRTPGSLTTLDGYAIFHELNTKNFFKSAQLDALTYDALDFDNADGTSDNIVKVQALQKELWILKEESTEIWSNVGGGGFPYQRISGGFIEIGCGARNSVVKQLNTLYWLGGDGIVYSSIGYSMERISHHGLEDAIRSYGDVSDAIGFIYTENGHKFFVLTFPSAPATWAFDIQVGAWAEKQSFEKERWRANTFSKAFMKNLVGDFENSNIYQLDLNTYSENNTTLQRKAISPIIHADTNKFTVDEFLLDIEPGTALITGQGSDPIVLLRTSRDGGKTWSNYKRKSIGKIGKYKKKLRWQQLGQFDKGGAVFEITISDPIQINIGAAYAMLSEGDN